MVTEDQMDALAAAVRRVHPFLSETQFQTEFAWAVQDIALSRSGHIVWRGFDLGYKLFLCLGEAQNWRCCFCGVHTNGTGLDAPTIEHITPLSLGGIDHPDNLAMSCYRCNTEDS